MFAKKAVCLFLALTVIGVFSFSPAAENQMTKLYVSPPKSASMNSKLSATLNALVGSDSTLIGQTGKGQLIIEVLKKDVDEVKASLKRGGAKAVEGGVSAKARPLPLRSMLIKYTPSKKEDLEKELKKQGYQIIEDYKPGSFLRVAPGKNKLQINALSTLSKLPSVVHVQIDRILRVPTPRPKKLQALVAGMNKLPNDLFWGALWGMRTINAPKAWSKGTELKKVVAVIDTGIDYTHEDLSSNIWQNPGVDATKQDAHGYDFVHDKGDPMDDNEHGSHCAGTIAAVGNNNLGVVGVGWKGQIMAVKFLDSSGSGQNSNAIKGIDYAIEKGANIISASWGGNAYDQLLYDAINRARTKGILFVAAAGNDGNDNDNEGEREYPCSYDLDNIISVMAVDKDDKAPDWSGFGKTTVHIAAPGVGILSCQPSNHYQMLDGTSMATPHVAGAAALVWSQPANAALDYKGIRKLLLDNARRVPGLKCVSGVLDLSFLDAKDKPKD